jgi:WbqC-like protein family
MKIAIMQPYIFPYIGYFQLIYAVDKFIVYDDVNFIKQGWVNRNNILLDGQPYLFSIPVENITSYKKINETKISSSLYDRWLNKFSKTLLSAYKKAPYFENIYPRIIEVLEKGKGGTSIASLCKRGVAMVTELLEMDVDIVDSSEKYQNGHLSSYERVIDICRQESGATYINAIGGKELYSKETFKENGIDLFFLKSNDVIYSQFAHEFIPHLSIIDVLMFNPTKAIKQHLQNFNLS